MNIQNYIIVDDDFFSSILSSIAIKNTLGEVEIKTFSVPEEGLAFIPNSYINNQKPTILFLDINMPTLSGWEFIEEFDKFPEEVRKQITIYFLSSSVDGRDLEKAKANKTIKGFVSKPLESETILSISAI